MNNKIFFRSCSNFKLYTHEKKNSDLGTKCTISLRQSHHKLKREGMQPIAIKIVEPDN